MDIVSCLTSSTGILYIITATEIVNIFVDSITKVKIYFLFSASIYFSLTLLNLITCDFYGDLMRVFGISETYSFAGLPLP